MPWWRTSSCCTSAGRNSPSQSSRGCSRPAADLPSAWDLPSEARFLGVFLDAVAAVGASPPAEIPQGPDFFRFSRDEEFAALLRDAGLDTIDVKTISFTHPVSSADDLWDGLLGGTVRTSALILGQPVETQQRIREAFDGLVEDYREGDALELPVSVKLAAGSSA
jgi:hypothetical protein